MQRYFLKKAAEWYVPRDFVVIWALLTNEIWFRTFFESGRHAAPVTGVGCSIVTN